MSGGNRKGPDNRGSMSGRGAGYCTGNDQPGIDNPGIPLIERLRDVCGSQFGWRGRVADRGREHRGVGFRNRWRSLRNSGAKAPEGEHEWLRSRAETLQSELKNINTRINNLHGATVEDSTRENK